MKKLLLDENLPKRLVRHFSAEFEVTSVHDLGWQSKTNGDLLHAMNGAGLELLITADKNLQFQQNLEKHSVKLLVLDTPDTRLGFLVEFVGEIEDAIRNSEPSNLVNVVHFRSK